MRARQIAAAFVSALLLSVPAQATQSSLQLTITTPSGEFEQRVTNYDCATEAPVQVTYINGAPNFLALVPVADEPQPLIFVAVLSASGARYAAGKWIWWSKGSDATLSDSTLPEDAEPVLTCSAISDIP